MRKYTRPFVGITADGRKEVFRALLQSIKPGVYIQVIGPFHTMRAAKFFATRPSEYLTVRQAELRSKVSED